MLGEASSGKLFVLGERWLYGSGTWQAKCLGRPKPQAAGCAAGVPASAAGHSCGAQEHKSGAQDSTVAKPSVETDFRLYRRL